MPSQIPTQVVEFHPNYQFLPLPSMPNPTAKSTALNTLSNNLITDFTSRKSHHHQHPSTSKILVVNNSPHQQPKSLCLVTNSTTSLPINLPPRCPTRHQVPTSLVGKLDRAALIGSSTRHQQPADPQIVIDNRTSNRAGNPSPLNVTACLLLPRLHQTNPSKTPSPSISPCPRPRANRALLSLSRAPTHPPRF